MSERVSLSEVDAEVAQLVFGKTRIVVKALRAYEQDDRGAETVLPAYSEDIAAAWLVVEQMFRRGPRNFELYANQWRGIEGFTCRFKHRGAQGEGTGEWAQGFAASAPLAICLAAIKALR